jgi:hypothetical protein
LSIVNNSDRKKIEEDLVGRMTEIEKRLTQLHAQAPLASVDPARSAPQRPTEAK